MERSSEKSNTSNQGAEELELLRKIKQATYIYLGKRGFCRDTKASHLRLEGVNIKEGKEMLG